MNGTSRAASFPCYRNLVQWVRWGEVSSVCPAMVLRSRTVRLAPAICWFACSRPVAGHRWAAPWVVGGWSACPGRWNLVDCLRPSYPERKDLTTTPRLRAALALLALTLPLAACSGDDDTDKDKSASDDSTAVDPSRVSPTDMPKVPMLRKAKGAIADASFGECATDYVVTVSWINDTPTSWLGGWPR